MNVLWKCCKRSLKENKSRTIVTILGVALATALICAVSCMGTSFLESYEVFLRQKSDWHARFTAVSKEDLKYFENNQALQEVWCLKRNGYGRVLQEADKACYLEMIAYNQDFYDHGKLTLTKGRLPEKEGEIIVGKTLRSDCGYDVRVGDEIEVEIGDRAVRGQLLELGTDYISGNKDPEDNETLLVRETKKFKIVGMYHDGYSNLLMARRDGTTHPVLRAYYFDETPGEYYDVYVRYTKAGLKNHEKVASGILGISEEALKRVFIDGKNVSEKEIRQVTKRAKDFTLNRMLILLENPSLLMKYYYAELGLVGLIYLFVIYAGVFCINNSFDLSFTERIRFYGMLSSVGTTKRQKRKIVWMEAIYIAGIGIPVGILAGCVLTRILVGFVNLAISILRRDMGFQMRFKISLAGILISVIVSATMVFLSAMESAVRSSRIMPLSAIRMNEFVRSGDKESGSKKGPKHKRTPSLLRKLFGPCGNVAYQNFKRSKLKYRASITSVAISVSLLMGFSFVECLFDVYEEMIYRQGGDPYWQIALYPNTADSYEKIKEVALFDGVTKSLFQEETMIQTEKGVIPYLDGIQLVYPDRLQVIVLDDDSFSELCRQTGVDPKEAMGKGIADSEVILWKSENMYEVSSELLPKTADFQNIKEIQGKQVKLGKTKGEYLMEEVSIEIAGQIDHAPGHVMNERWAVTIYVDQSFKEKYPELIYQGRRGFFLCEDAIALENAIEDMELQDCYVVNVDQDLKTNQFTKILVISLMGGFIFVIFLICVTNVINAISTNMELRAPEYAKLIAIGMTGKQFKGMLWAEGAFIAGKGLAYGLAIGYAISYALYRFFWEVDDKQFTFGWRIPIWESLAAIFAVAIMMMIVLRCSRKKLQKKNLIETIRGENI